MTSIKLTLSEIQQAAIVGLNRHLYALAHRNKGDKEVKDNFNPDLTGAIGEMAVCKYLDLFWASTVGEMQKNDIKGFKRPIDVKTATFFNPKNVYVNDANPPEYYNGFDLIFVAYSGQYVKLLGEITAEEYFEKAERVYLPNKRPFWSLPVGELKKPVIIDRPK